MPHLRRERTSVPNKDDDKDDKSRSSKKSSKSSKSKSSDKKVEQMQKEMKSIKKSFAQMETHFEDINAVSYTHLTLPTKA